MKFIAALLFASLFPVCALAAPPSLESIERLFQLAEIDRMMDMMAAQSDQMMRAGMDEALRRNDATPEMRQKAEATRARMSAVMREELSMAKLKPLIVQVYVETFTQEEVDGLIAFYESPAGRAMISKMPIVMNRTMGLLQQRMGPLMERMQRSMQEQLGGR